MLKMKKTLGILLAVCFLLSVTVAAVSAAPGPGAGQAGPGAGKNLPVPSDAKKWRYPRILFKLYGKK
jgi:hypothetical protein